MRDSTDQKNVPHFCANCHQPFPQFDDDKSGVASGPKNLKNSQKHMKLVYEIPVTFNKRSSLQTLFKKQELSKSSELIAVTTRKRKRVNNNQTILKSMIKVDTVLAHIYKFNYNHNDNTILNGCTGKLTICEKCAAILTRLFKSYSEFNQLRHDNSVLAQTIERMDPQKKVNLDKLSSSSTAIDDHDQQDQNFCNVQNHVKVVNDDDGNLHAKKIKFGPGPWVRLCRLRPDQIPEKKEKTPATTLVAIEPKLSKDSYKDNSSQTDDFVQITDDGDDNWQKTLVKSITPLPPPPEKSYECKICTKTFTMTLQDFHVHLSSHVKSRHQCPICQFEASSPKFASLATHIAFHVGFKPRLAPIKIEEIDQKRPEKQDETSFHCHLCSKIFCSGFGWKLHLKRHINKDGEGQKNSNTSARNSSSAMNQSVDQQIGQKNYEKSPKPPPQMMNQVGSSFLQQVASKPDQNGPGQQFSGGGGVTCEMMTRKNIDDNADRSLSMPNLQQKEVAQPVVSICDSINNFIKFPTPNLPPTMYKNVCQKCGKLFIGQKDFEKHVHDTCPEKRKPCQLLWSQFGLQPPSSVLQQRQQFLIVTRLPTTTTTGHDHHGSHCPGTNCLIHKMETTMTHDKVVTGSLNNITPTISSKNLNKTSAATSNRRKCVQKESVSRQSSMTEGGGGGADVVTKVRRWNWRHNILPRVSVPVVLTLTEN